MSRSAKREVLFVKAFVRRLCFTDETATVDPTWSSPFVVTECSTVSTIEEMAIVAVGKWPLGIMPLVDVFECDSDGVVTPGTAPLPPQKPLVEIFFRTFPVAVCVVSRPSFDCPREQIDLMYAALREFTLLQCRRMETEIAKQNRLRLGEVSRKREENLKLLDARRQQNYVKSVLAAHMKEDERVMRLKAERQL